MAILTLCILGALAGCSESGAGKGSAGAQSVKAAETNGLHEAAGSQR
ncbi:MAG: hypothetical protein JWN25_2420 [Verrucomicrobiales bacterium]|nr:hypothetical protein [Verrucomicrobiales bacterium]